MGGGGGECINSLGTNWCSDMFSPMLGFETVTFETEESSRTSKPHLCPDTNKFVAEAGGDVGHLKDANICASLFLEFLMAFTYFAVSLKSSHVLCFYCLFSFHSDINDF